MIAELGASFGDTAVLNSKISYHLSKIEKGTAEVLDCSLTENLKTLSEDMQFFVSQNERVKNGFMDVSLNLNPGENLSNEQFMKLAKEYLKRMGYEDTCYAVIRHTDKEHSHIHILATRVDMEGKRVDPHNERYRSQRISRELEKEFALRITEYEKFNSKALGEMKAREYYFHNALQKGLKNLVTDRALSNLFADNEVVQAMDLNKPRNNREYEMVLGEELYNRVGEVLEQNKHFNTLYKDELLQAMDKAFAGSKNVDEFRSKLQDEGYYIRMVTVKGNSHFVYGIPHASVYIKDKAFPEKYRYGQMTFGEKMDVDAQKHYIYNQAFIALNASGSMDEFKEKMLLAGIAIVEHSNASGVYGLSFSMQNIDNAKVFKASEVSRKLTYANLMHYFAEQSVGGETAKVARNEKIVESMKDDLVQNFSFLTTFVDEMKQGVRRDDEENAKKKKKKKRREITR